MEKSQEDLHESEHFQVQCLEQFREWIHKDTKIKKCRTDDEFLLRFLRMKKFSIPNAFQPLVRNLTERKRVPHFFENLDINDPDLDRFITDGIVTLLPQMDAQGGPIALYQLDNFNWKTISAKNCARMTNLMAHIFCRDPTSQADGVTIIADYSALTLDMLQLVTLNILRDCIVCWHKSLPAHPRVIYVVNFPAFAKPIYIIVKPFLKETVWRRIKFITGWEVIQQELGVSVLPKEVGGIIPRAELSRMTKMKALEHRDEILAMSDFDIEVDCKDFNLGNVKDSELDAAIVGSFRKLEVD